MVYKREDLAEYKEYSVSGDGEVFSIKSGVKKKLKPMKKPNGYLYVTLCKNGKKKNFYIHRLVAIHFVKNKYDKIYVDHIDRNKENNYYKNLEWVTHKENMDRKNGVIS